MDLILYSKGQGQGYITENSTELEKRFKPVAVKFCFGSIEPGHETTLKGFFDRHVKYIGYDQEEKELLFYLGYDSKKYYYESIYYITETRLFQLTQYQPTAGRDWNFKNGVWK